LRRLREERRPVRGILIDKDGTLLDFHANWLALARNMALEAAGGDAEGAAARLAAVGYDADSGRFAPDSIFAAGTNLDIVRHWYPDATAAERRQRLDEFDRRSVEYGGRLAIPVKGAVAALHALRGAGLRLGVATNDATGGAEATLSALGIAQLFDAVFGYDAVARPKPAPDMMIAFADMTGLKPSELAMVGDNRHDLETGRSAGAGLVIGVLSGTGTRETLAPFADLIMDSIADLPGFLAGQR